MEPIETQINQWADVLSKRLTEIKYVDMEEMKKTISVYIKMAIHDCIKIDISETERKLNQKKLVLHALQGQNTQKVQGEISELKFKLKQGNLMKSQMEQIEKLGMLIKFVSEKHPGTIPEFYEKFKLHVDTFSNIDQCK